MIFMLFIQAFLEDRSSHLEVQKFGSSSTTRTVGTNVEKKVVSVRTSVDPKATAAERAMTIVLFWLAMFLRYITLVFTKVGIMRIRVFLDFKTQVEFPADFLRI